jgi:hypothetical protein
MWFPFSRGDASEGQRAKTDSTPVDRVDHAAFGLLLAKYVDDRGRVAYARWKADAADVRALHAYLVSLGGMDPDAPAPRAAKVAFWINAYNAATIAAILHLYPTASIRDHAGVIGFNVWKDFRLPVGGRLYSLDDLEHDVLRLMGEPRVHFALVCASNWCPALRNRAYTPDGLDGELDADARQFFERPESFRADPDQRVVSLSHLLLQYGTDFAPTPAEQVGALRRFFPQGEGCEWLDGGNVRVEFLPYDWSLNEQHSQPGEQPEAGSSK